jgi:myo-inositol-1(or 4)-monophosphatase
MTAELERALAAAKAGGKIVAQLFGTALTIEEKTSLADLRTQADVQSEQAIIAELTGAFPAYNIYAEESGEIKHDSAYTFVVDPLDGTHNFVLGIPDFAISIGLLKDNEAIAGVIYNPILDQIYYAEKGTGAFMNGKRLRVNTERDVRGSTVSYTCGYHTARDYSERIVHSLHDVGVKRLIDHWAPAYDYCLLAAGRIEAVISKEGDLEDYVAAKIIVNEAGGKITDFHGQPVEGRAGNFVASNGTPVHEALLKLLP